MKNLKVILTGKILLIILIVVSFIVGTFNPNFITVDKIEHNVATKYINEAKILVFINLNFYMKIKNNL